MRKIGKSRRDSDMLPEYDFRVGERGEYATRYKRSSEADIPEMLYVWAPLIGFRWAGSERQVADDTCIRQDHTEWL